MILVITAVCASGPRKSLVLNRMAAGKENEKQLDIKNSDIVNYISI